MPSCIPGTDCYRLKARRYRYIAELFFAYADAVENLAELTQQEEINDVKIKEQEAIINRIQEQISENFVDLQNITNLQETLSERLENTGIAVSITQIQLQRSARNIRNFAERSGEPVTNIPLIEQKKLTGRMQNLLRELL